MISRFARAALAVSFGWATGGAADTYVVGKLGPYGTLQAAVDAAMSGAAKNGSGNAVIIVGPGTWRGANVAGPTPNAGGNIGRSYVQIVGAGPGRTVIEDNSGPAPCGTIVATNGAAVMIENLTIKGNPKVSCQSAVFAQNNATLLVWDNVEFGSTPMQHMHAEANGVIEIGASKAAAGYHVSGGAYNHWGASTGGVIVVDPTDLILTFDQVSFTHFAWAQSRGVILVGEKNKPDATGVELRGLANVQAKYRYVLRSNAVLDLNCGHQPLPGSESEISTGAEAVNGLPDRTGC